MFFFFFFFQAEDGIRDRSPSRGLGDVYKRQVALDLQRAIDESGLKISELVESRSFRKLSALFGSYYKNQLSADFIGREDYTNIYAFYHPILVEIPDDVFLSLIHI